MGSIGNEIVKKWCPIAWTAFTDYKLNAVSFSSSELEILSLLQSGIDVKEIQTHFMKIGFYIKNDTSKPSRELVDFEKKLLKHNFKIIWKEQNI